MGNCLPLSAISIPKTEELLPIETIFKLPSPTPSWPSSDGGFAKGIISLGGLTVCQISTFTKVWATHEGGPDDLGATFFKPSQMPTGFFMLGCYCQSNNKPLFGWVLAGKDDGNGDSNDVGRALMEPVDYTLVWSSESENIKQDGYGYIWLPTPPEGYRAVGHLITNSPEKPSLDEIWCVRSDLTDECENETWIWGKDEDSSTSGPNVYGLRPTVRGIQAQGVCVGTFIVQVDGVASSLSCLKNSYSNLSSMPNLTQIEALVQAYSPYVYFHSEESYLPCSVSWYFNNGALLYDKDDPNPVPIYSTGSNLPQGGSNDGNYWLDLPIDEVAKEKVKKGDLQSAEAYLHVKPMLGATFTDIQIWVFYAFNGPATAKVRVIDVPLGKIGEHVGDWEHATLRISNFNGVLWRVYLAEHSSGEWLDASEVEFQGGNKVVAYASLNGHALYPKVGIVLQGSSTLDIGIINETERGKNVMDTGLRSEVVAAEHLGEVVEPPWLNYARLWGPKITYQIADEINKVVDLLPDTLEAGVEGFVDGLPSELFGEDGPTGPKMKNNWSGDEA